MDLENLIGQRIMFALPGKDRLPEHFGEILRVVRPGGVTLFRHLNVESPGQVRRLTEQLQAAACQAGLPPLLIGVDQEGGQLMAIGEGVTQLPGNLALGAAGSSDLARQAGRVLGSELAAMGINVNYAPCSDVNVNPRNPVIGTRSFGEDPIRVGELAAAMAEGIQEAGVAATAKHFPGHGDTHSDSHHGLPAILHGVQHLRAVEFPPFAAAIRSGVKLVMTGHLALPLVTGREDLPATLSPQILTNLLRDELGFEGVTITDAMDMKAIRQGEKLAEDALSAAAAGADLLLLTDQVEDIYSVSQILKAALSDGRLETAAARRSLERIQALKTWLAGQAPAPDLAVVGCTAHRTVADEIAARSITLVRDQDSLLPLHLDAGDRLVVVIPQPVDLTLADTSSYIRPSLAAALKEYHRNVEEILLPHHPTPTDTADCIQRINGARAVVIATLNAFASPGQSQLVQSVLRTGIPTLVAALRMPYDLAAFPDAPAFLCTYSILEPSMQALASVIFGQAGAPGHLPVTIPGLYPLGSGIG